MHGFLLSGGAFTSIDFPGAILTQAWKINAAGQIVGRYYDADGKHHVFLLSGGEFTTIDFPGAIETAVGRFSDNGGINPRGDIVSDYCDVAPYPAQAGDSTGNVHGFLFSRGGQEEENSEFTPIDFPGALGTIAFGINARGDIVGVYIYTSGQAHGFLRSRRELDEDEATDENI